MEHIAELGGIVTGFSVGEQWIDCMCGKELLKIDRRTRDVVLRKSVFEKEGLSRKLVADEECLIAYDFCTLYIFRRKDLELLGQWRLGADVSSDLCGLTADEHTVYCAIRNGGMVALDRQTFSIRESHVSESSMWSLSRYAQCLVCGTVDGKVLLLDRTTLSVARTLVLGKKNVGSLFIDGDILYAASHDGNIFKIGLKNFEVEAMAKNAHKKMFDCAGIWRGMLVTVSHPCSEIALWNKDTLERVKVVHVPLRLSGRTHIENDALYLSSRNILGIGLIHLDEMVNPG